MKYRLLRNHATRRKTAACQFELLEHRHLLAGDLVFELQQPIAQHELWRKGAVATADIDADGDMDLVVGGDGVPDVFFGTGATRLSWLENDGLGQFVERTLVDGYQSGGAIRSLKIADIDSDGYVDIVVMRFEGSKLDSVGTADVGWYRNQDGKGSFSSAIPVAEANQAIVDFDVHDVNLDGTLDVVYATANSILWASNANGRGRFGDGTLLSAKDEIGYNGIAVADVDGDRYPDIVAASLNDRILGWFKNNGNGHFEDRETITSLLTQQYSAKVIAEDLDADGDVDLLLAQNHVVTSIKNLDGNAAWGKPTNIFVAASVGPPLLETYDVDSDGDQDAVIYTESPRALAWLENNGGNEFLAEPHSIQLNGTSVMAYISSFVMQDFDQDNRPDIVTTGDNVISFYSDPLAADGGPRKLVTDAFSDLNDSHLADVDSDGDLDAIATSYALGAVFWYENDGAGKYSSPRFIDQDIPWVQGALPGDIDADGDLDLVVTRSTSGATLVWYEQIESEFVRHEIPKSTGLYTYGDTIKLVDVEGDGDLDLTAPHTSSLSLLQFDSASREFTPTKAIATFATGSLAAIAPGDFDADGDIDILAGFVSQKESYVAWFVNQGQGVFERREGRYELTPKPESILGMAIGDVDHDGDVDVAIATRFYDESSNPMLLLALMDNTDGLGTLSTPTTLFTDTEGYYHPYASLQLRDFETDGDLDLLARVSFCDDYSGCQRSDVSLIENLSEGFAEPRLIATANNVIGSFGSLDVGDINGDDVVDLLVGSPSYGDNFTGFSGIYWYAQGANPEVLISLPLSVINEGSTAEFNFVVENHSIQDVLNAQLAIQPNFETAGISWQCQGAGETVCSSGESTSGAAVDLVTIPAAGAIEYQVQLEVPIGIQGIFSMMVSLDAFGQRFEDVVTLRVRPNGSPPGTGRFHREIAATSSIDYVELLFPCDANGDGIDDLVASDGYSFAEVLENDGNGVFARSDFTINAEGEQIYFGDLDGDGSDDLLVRRTNWKTNVSTVQVLLRRNRCRFVDQLPPVPVMLNEELSVADDLDGDGDTDLLFQGFSSNAVDRLFRNDGQGVFSLIGEAIDWLPSRALAADFDRDGDVDLFTQGGQGFVVHLNDGDAGFTEKVSFPALFTGGIFSSSGFDLGDSNADGYPDVFGLRYDNDQKTWETVVFLNDQSLGLGAPEVVAPQPSAGLPAGDFDLADLDGDGDLDAIGQYGRGVFLRSGDESFENLAGEFRGDYGRIIYGDFDGDQDVDLIVTTSNENDEVAYELWRQSETTSDVSVSVDSAVQVDSQGLFRTVVSISNTGPDDVEGIAIQVSIANLEVDTINFGSDEFQLTADAGVWESRVSLDAGQSTVYSIAGTGTPYRHSGVSVRLSDPAWIWVDANASNDARSAEFIEAIAGDTNLDGSVDFADFLVLSANFGRANDVVFAHGDFTADGAVSFADFLILSANFGRLAGSAETLGGNVP